MRNFYILALFLSMVFVSTDSAAAIFGVDEISRRSLVPPSDTLRDRAILLLETHMENLTNLQQRSAPFKTGFLKNNPTVPCDYCEQSQEIELSSYVSNLLAPDRYPGGLKFTYERIERYDDIVVQEFERGLYHVTLNVKKTVTGLFGAGREVREDKSRTTYLNYVFELNYNDNMIGIVSLTETKSPGSNVIMIEVSPNFRLTSPDFSNQDVFDASASSAALVKLGAVYYFNPFKGVNKANLWFKTGLRISYLSSNISSNIVDFRRGAVELDGHSIENPHQIDLLYGISDVDERLTAVGIEIPIGFSKRFTLDDKKELSFEVEMSYTYEVVKQVSGGYVSDITGNNHLFNNDIQSSSGGSPAVYQSSPQAVLSSSGEVIGFSRGNAGSLDVKEATSLGYLSFSFRPSIFLKKFDKIKYNIGLNFSYAAIGYDSYSIDEMYFDVNSNNFNAPLHEADQSTSHFFAGVFFAIKI